MPVLISSEHISFPEGFDLNAFQHTAEEILTYCGLEERELSIHFVNDSRMAELNGTYRHKPVPTNVLAFPMDDDSETLAQFLLGDIVISVDTALREALLDDIPFLRRLEILLIHGIVHLMGFDHERSENDEILMQAEEKRLLEKLKGY